MSDQGTGVVGRIRLLYVALASSWILLSDHLLVALLRVRRRSREPSLAARRAQDGGSGLRSVAEELRVLHVTAFLCLHAVGVAVGAPLADEHLHFRRLTPEDGLPTEQVQRIFEDSRGFLWFGTSDGLARYDSHEFRVFRPDPKDPGSLVNRSVSDIQEDAQGNLWIATLGGLDLWHRDTERFSHIRHDVADTASLSSDKTWSLLLDGDGSLWVGTTVAGLNHLDPRSGKWKRFGPQADRSGSLSGAVVNCLLRDRRGVLWVGTGDRGLNQLDSKTGRFRAYEHDPGDPRSLGDDRVTALAEDSEGYLWVGTANGISRLDPERRFFERLSASVDDPGALQSPVVGAVLVDRDGGVWVGTDGGGLSRYDRTTRRFTQYRHSKYESRTLASDVVRTILQDRSGDLWIGHFPAGVSHADRLVAPFRVFSSVPGEANTLSDEHVLSFVEDPSGGLWAGTDEGGLNHWHEATARWTCFRHDPHDPRSLGAKAVLALLRDSRGRLWVGTWGGGLNVFEPGTRTFHRYLPEPNRASSPSSAQICSLVEDQQGRLWVGTWGGGVDRYVPDEHGFVHHRNDRANARSLNSDFVSSLLVTRDGTLWVGTTEGLARWVPTTQSWDRFQSQSGRPGTLSDDSIIDLLEDRGGIIWVCTEGGLNRLDPRSGSFENLRTTDGLPSDVLRGILEDADGMLWIASNQGLARLDPRTRKVRIFDENDGLPGRQFSSGARLRLRSGELLFGTTQGFVRFDPGALQPNTDPPPVVLTGFEVFNQPMLPGRAGSPLRQSITETRRLEVPARLSVLAFQFAALNYRSSARSQYRFMLEGFDEDWRKPGPERRATYTNLDPGRYRLRVKAANSDGVWNEAGVDVELTVVPPWWRTWWFRSAAALGVLVGAVTTGWVTSGHRSRARLREAERERQAAQERGRAEALLRESERRYRELVENANSIILRWTRDGRILFLNEFGQRFFGYTEAEVCGRHVIGTLVPETETSGRNLTPLMEEICANPAAFEQSVNENVRRNGEHVWIAWTNKVAQEQQGEVAEILSIGLDITARKRIEEELREAQGSLEQRVARRTAELAVAKDRAEAADRTKSAFLATMSHELRTPLNSIIGFTGLLLRGLAGPLNAEQAKQLRMVKDSGQHLLALINDVLDISKIEAGQIEIACAPFDLQEAIQKVIQAVSPLADKKQLRLAAHVAPDARRVTSDRRRVEQVLLNLLGNAVKFTERGSITVRADGGPGTVEISVADTGPGIEPEDLGKLFQPFRQLDTGLTRRHEGTGLGLAICRRLLERLGGTIWVESEPGKGSTFRFTLPARTPEQP